MLRLAVTLTALSFAAPAIAQQPSSDAGKRAFQRCVACHSVEPGASNRFGPSLNGVVGRKVASLPGYNFSTALRAQNFVWSEAQLDKWLKNPRALVPGTTMPFAGISDAAERKAVIAYLKNPSGR
jgi:cytochrome c